jgi:hypothetical protein
MGLTERQGLSCNQVDFSVNQRPIIIGQKVGYNGKGRQTAHKDMISLSSFFIQQHGV